MPYRVEPDRRYTKTHEWLKIDGDLAVVGVTDYAQHQLSDLVFVDLPAIGEQVERGTSFVTLESVKAVSDVFAPIAGTVVAVNTGLTEHPEWVNGDPFGNGWLVKLTPRAPGEADDLLDAAAYTAHLATVE